MIGGTSRDAEGLVVVAVVERGCDMVVEDEVAVVGAEEVVSVV